MSENCSKINIKLYNHQIDQESYFSWFYSYNFIAYVKLLYAHVSLYTYSYGQINIKYLNLKKKLEKKVLLFQVCFLNVFPWYKEYNRSNSSNFYKI